MTSLVLRSKLDMIRMPSESTWPESVSCRYMQRLSKRLMVKLWEWRSHILDTMSNKFSHRWVRSSNSSNMKHHTNQQKLSANLWALFTNTVANWHSGGTLQSLQSCPRSSDSLTIPTTKRWLLPFVYLPTTIGWKKEWPSNVCAPMQLTSTIEILLEQKSETERLWSNSRRSCLLPTSIHKMPVTILRMPSPLFSSSLSPTSKSRCAMRPSMWSSFQSNKHHNAKHGLMCLTTDS